MTTTPELGAERAELPDGPRAPHGRSPSVRPALVVLACAAVVSFGGFAVALIGSGQAGPPTVTGLATPVPGVNLLAVGGAQVLQRISHDGSPPKDVLEALVVPKGARIINTSVQDASIDLYDRSIYFEIDTTSKELLTFYEVELKRSVLGGHRKVPGPGLGRRDPRPPGRVGRLRMGGRCVGYPRQSRDLTLTRRW